MVKNLPAMWETRVRSLGREDSPGEGNGTPLQYSCLENPMDGGAWWATVHGVATSQTRLSNFTFTFTLGIPDFKQFSSLVAQRLKRLPAMQETRVRSLGREDSPGEGNGNPLQYSCLENPRDGRAWLAAVCGVAQSRTRLKRPSSSIMLELQINTYKYSCLEMSNVPWVPEKWKGMTVPCDHPFLKHQGSS